MAEQPNPYVGPYAFQEKDAPLFFGRDEEADKLLALVGAERIVLLCSSSGAGKTSLINARLIPGLRNQSFDVLPVARVGGQPEPGSSPANVFVYSVLRTLAGECEDLSALQDCTLDAFLRLRPTAADGAASPSRVLVLDQFEEVLNTHRERWRDREGFFLQLRQALLDDPALSVLLSMREDHLAGLDPYAKFLPAQIRRLRLERLRRDCALHAVHRPANTAGRRFAEGVAERLVENLSLQRAAGEEETFPGELVEPVQLQVVCYQLWENLRDRPGDTISAQDLHDFGDIDQALERFYEDAVSKAAAKTGASQASLRRWCGTALITPTGTRRQVSREAKTSGGLANHAVDALVDLHLVRRERTPTFIWYELAHDRFIEPVLSSNRKAQPPEVTSLANRAQVWQQQERDPSYLYRGQELRNALELSADGSLSLTTLEQDFLTESRAAEADARTRAVEAEARAREARRLKLFTGALLALALILTILANYAWLQGREAHSKELAYAAIERKTENQSEALALAIKAAETDVTPEAENALHQILEDPSLRHSRVTLVAGQTARALAVSHQGLLTAGIGKNRIVKVWDRSTSHNPILSLAAAGPEVTSLAFAPDDRSIATGDAQGRIVLWSLDGRRLWDFDLGSSVNALAFSPEGSRLAAAGDKPDAILWNLATGQRDRPLAGAHSGALWSLAFSADGRQLAAAGEDGKVFLWDLKTGKAGPPLLHPKEVTGLAFGPKGLLATSCLDGYARLWDKNGNLKRVFPHLDEVWDIAFGRPDSRYLATVGFTTTASSRGTAKIWDAETGREIRSLDLPCGEAKRVVYAPDGRQGMSLILSCEPRIEGTERGRIFTWTQLPAAATLLQAGAAQDNVPLEMGFSADSRFLLAAGSAGARLWHLRGQDWEPAPPLRRRPAINLPDREPGGRDARAISLDGQWLAEGKPDGFIQICNAGSPRICANLAEKQDAIQSLAFSPDGQQLASTGFDKSIRLWNVASRRLTGRIAAGSIVTRLAFSPDGQRLAGASTDDAVKIWDTKSQAQLFKLRRTGVTSLAYSPDSRWLAVASSDGTIRLEPMLIDDLGSLARSRR